LSEGNIENIADESCHDMMVFENGNMNAIGACDVVGESGKEDEAVGDRATFEIRMDHLGRNRARVMMGNDVNAVE
jgi:hypothetical protein